MTTTATTKQQKLDDLRHAREILEAHREEISNGNALVLFSAEYGKGLTDYFRVTIAFTRNDGQVTQSHLTWAIAKALGYGLRDRNGYWFVTVSGYGFSKTDQIARDLATFYGIPNVRYERA